VSFSYEPGIEVLHDIDLHIQAGKTVALVGPTGAGKSTMVNLIARFYDVTGGRIMVDGHDLRNLDKIAYRKHLGLVLQDPFLFSATVRENIRYGRWKPRTKKWKQQQKPSAQMISSSSWRRVTRPSFRNGGRI